MFWLGETDNLIIMETKKVYVVTSGDYSDYHIVGIFDSREKAEEYINHSANSDLNEIEEYNLNELPDKSEKVFKLESEFDVIDFKVIGYGPESILYKDLMCRADNCGFGPRNVVVLFVCADTRERAIKIASERLRQVKVKEHFRYPLLRRPIGVRCNDYKKQIYPFVHYHTGEVVLPYYFSLIPGSIPQDLSPYVKVITMEELEERCKKERKK